MSEDNSFVRLEKIQGGVDLINERLKHSNEIQNERHAAMLASIAELHAVDALHDTRIGSLETSSSVQAGQRQGLALSGRIAWAGIGSIIGGGGIAALMRLSGY